MKNKIRLFLFALGLSASYAYAQVDYNTCIEICEDEFIDCLTVDNQPPRYCVPRLTSCKNWCNGWSGTGPIP